MVKLTPFWLSWSLGMNSWVNAFWTRNWNADGSTCTIEKSFLAMEVETDKWFIWNKSSTLKKTITKTIMRKMREIMPPVMERYEVWPLNLIYVGYGSLSKLFMIEPNPIGYIINILIDYNKIKFLSRNTKFLVFWWKNYVHEAKLLENVYKLKIMLDWYHYFSTIALILPNFTNFSMDWKATFVSSVMVLNQTILSML